MLAGIARQKAGLLQRAAQLGVEFDECAGDTKTNGACLTGGSAAVGQHQHIKAILHLDRTEGLLNRDPARFGREIVLKFAAIDGDLSRSRPQEHAGDTSLATPGPEILLDFL